MAQAKPFGSPKNLSISDGLAHNGVTSLLEDSQGYLWVGTYDGLNQYDGFKFVTYKNTPDTELIASNRVRSLAQDPLGNLWIGTDDGITIYDYESQQFKTIYSNKLTGKGLNGPIIRSIIVQKDKGWMICATELDGLLIFNTDYQLKAHYIPSLGPGSLGVLFQEGVEIGEGIYVYATSAGLLQFDSNKGHFRRVYGEKLPSCVSVTRTPDSHLIVAGQDGVDILKFTKSSQGVRYKWLSHSLSSQRFKIVRGDMEGRLWLGTLNDGTIRVNSMAQLLSADQRGLKPLEPTDFVRVSSILLSPTSGCWVGTFNKGLYNYNLKPNPFSFFDFTQGKTRETGVQKIIGHLSAFNDKEVLLSNRTGGLNLLNTENHTIRHFPYKLPLGGDKIVGRFMQDSKHHLWVNYNALGRLYRIGLEEATTELITFRGAPLSLTIQSMSEDRFGNIWIGGVEGAYKITVNKDGSIGEVFSLNNLPYFKQMDLSLVRALYADPEYDFMWLGTDAQGLFRIKITDQQDPALAPVDHYVFDRRKPGSISSNFVSSILRLPNHELWIGTERGGICQVLQSDTEPRFLAFTEKNGLSNNVVKAILPTSDNNLWISTNIGLNYFNTTTKTFRNLTANDGLPFEDFNYSAVRLNNGNFVFTGLDGITYFKAEAIDRHEAIPKLQFGSLLVKNKMVAPSDTLNGRVVLHQRLRDGGQVELKYSEDVFSIEVNSLHFSSSVNHFIRYRLLPENQEWIKRPSNQKFINYAGLKPGEYTLEVAVSNALNEWSAPQQLNIVISPPFWRTFWAYLLYLVLIAVGIYVVIQVFLRIQGLQHKVALEQLELETGQRISEAKLTFFSNISHEIKTPVTLILGTIELLSKQMNAGVGVREKLNLVLRQSKKISQLIDQVQDFQRADTNLLRMHPDTFSFDAFVAELVGDYQVMALAEQKTIEVIAEDSAEIFVRADPDKMEKILNNLLSNAFKHTSTGAVIRVLYRTDQQQLLITVHDNGKGIHPKDLPHILERFYQSKYHQQEYVGGSGIGLAFTKVLVEMHYGQIDIDSTLGVGTSVMLRLPVVAEPVDSREREEETILLKNEAAYQPSTMAMAPYDRQQVVADSSFAGATVFLAEDNPDMRTFVAEVLGDFYQVKSFGNGQECLDALEEEWPDVIISDVLMPVLNGFELCKRVKADVSTSHIPVILLTACISVDDQITGLNQGADGYIKKPFDIQQLISTTDSVLRTRKQIRERFDLGLPLQLQNTNAKDQVFMEKLYRLMESNLDNENLDISDFTKELYLSRTHLYQKVKAITNQTPFDLLKTYRLNKAAQYLLQGEYSVNDVYLMTGFKSRTHFSKAFKEAFGTSPGKYAKAQPTSE
ncbi:hybrid sensor histidine kinase/response regulator transcription factor [Dyadobacter jejuensis]|uniref:hybrid sensor histidine kinase/response regulator transcription factor n=1 Tax=Dyadobacter jejuensis TaxID=1082580 RepID=UPI0013049B16|nr:hybrid sensor histidine kinase/response regulator transcription factor [Dyadobacter jejuensis]